MAKSYMIAGYLSKQLSDHLFTEGKGAIYLSSSAKLGGCFSIRSFRNMELPLRNLRRNTVSDRKQLHSEYSDLQS
jgi:hypothetical protein